MNGMYQLVLFGEERQIPLVLGQIRVVDGADVSSGAKGLLARALQHDGINAGVRGPAFEIPGQASYHGQIQGIQGRWPVQAQVGGAAIYPRENRCRRFSLCHSRVSLL